MSKASEWAKSFEARPETTIQYADGLIYKLVVKVSDSGSMEVQNHAVQERTLIPKEAVLRLAQWMLETWGEK